MIAGRVQNGLRFAIEAVCSYRVGQFVELIMNRFFEDHMTLDADDIRELMVPVEEPAERLDRVLAQSFADLSRNRLQGLIRDGRVNVDGSVVTDTKRKVGGGTYIVIRIPPAVAPEPMREDIPLNVIYEDNDLIVIDKPAGLVVHPGAGHDTGTLVNALINHCGDSLSGIGGVKRPGIVHRLDKDTSGLMVVAKNDRAHHSLAEQFADHGKTGPLERAYLALVWGSPGRKPGTVDAPLARSIHNREKIEVVRPAYRRYYKDDEEEVKGRGRHALTHFSVEEIFGDQDGEPLVALLRCVLETGRTHQIRVHMAHIGHPLLGDSVYGSGFRTKATKLTSEQCEALRKLNRQALHAAVLGFEHPTTGETLRFESGPPPDLAALLQALRN